MATYYKQQRIEKNILMEGDKPIGEKWSFDEENRKKIPDNFPIPSLPNFTEDSVVKDVKKTVEDFFSDHPGDVNSFWLGTSRKDALKALDSFIKDKIINFGDYEDAVKKKRTLFITQCS